MASSPTTLVDSANSRSQVSYETSAEPKLSIRSLLFVGTLALAVSAAVSAGVVFYLMKTGRFPIKAAVSPKSSATIPSTHPLPLEPLLVNLADPGGSAYLRVAITLRVADGEGTNEKNEKTKDAPNNDDSVAAVRDTVLTVLGTQKSDDLLAAEGKERLKAELKTALSHHNNNLRVTDVFFTDFLVQR